MILLLTIFEQEENERQGVSLLRSRFRCKSSRTGKLYHSTDSVLLLETTESGIEVRVTTDLASSFASSFCCIGVWKKCSSNVAKASSVSSLSFLRNQEERRGTNLQSSSSTLSLHEPNFYNSLSQVLVPHSSFLFLHPHSLLFSLHVQFEVTDLVQG